VTSTEARSADSTLAEANAVGIAMDNPEDPHVAVAVYGGRIVYIGISNAMMRGNRDELQDVINACILSAFLMWGAQKMGVVEL
jgi:hypothetical protein